MKKAYLFALIGILFFGCSSPQKLAGDITEGIGNKSSLISKNLVLGLDSGLAASTLRAQLCATIDSIITVAGISSNKSINLILDSIMNRKWSAQVQQLVEDISGRQTRQNLENIRETLLGARTKEDVQALINTLLNEDNFNKIVQLKNGLLGDTTARQLGAITDTMMAHIANRLNNDITDSTLNKIARFSDNFKNGLKSDVDVIQRQAYWFLGGLALAAAIIIAVVWNNRQKYLKLTTLLAAQVNALPDKNMYDLITARIKEHATTAGVEPTLRSVLQENNLLNDSSWKPLPKQ